MCECNKKGFGVVGRALLIVGLFLACGGLGEIASAIRSVAHVMATGEELP